MAVRPRQRHIIVRAVGRHCCERLMALAWLLGAKFLARVWVGKASRRPWAVQGRMEA